MKDPIKAGDKIDVHFSTTQSEFGVEVVYTPSEPGDSWVLRRPDGVVVYVMHYSKIVRTGE